MARSGVEPDVENVVFLAEFVATALGTSRVGAEQFGGAARVPDVGGVFGKLAHDRVEVAAIGERVAALLAIEDGDRDAPHALARDAPVGAHGDHVGDALLAPGGVPGDALDGLQGFGPQAVQIHADEPLLGGAEDGRMVAAPAVRIAVLEVLFGEQRAVLA